MSHARVIKGSPVRSAGFLCAARRGRLGDTEGAREGRGGRGTAAQVGRAGDVGATRGTGRAGFQREPAAHVAGEPAPLPAAAGGGGPGPTEVGVAGGGAGNLMQGSSGAVPWGGDTGATCEMAQDGLVSSARGCV